MNFVQQSNY